MNDRELKLRAELTRLVKSEHKIVTNTTMDVETIQRNLGTAKNFGEENMKCKLETMDPDAIYCQSPILTPIGPPIPTYGLPLNHETYAVALQNHSIHRIVNEVFPGDISMLNLHSIQDMICIGGDGFLGVFNQKDGRCVIKWVTTSFIRNCVRCIVFYSEVLMFGSDDGYVRVYHPGFQAIVEEFPAHEDPVTYMASVDCPISVIITATDKGEVKAWNATTLQCEHTIQIGQNESIRGCAAGSGPNSIILVTHDNRPIVWDLETGETGEARIGVSQKYSNSVFSLIVNERSVTVVDKSNNTVCVSLDMGGNPITQVECTKDFIALASGNRFNLWRVHQV